LDNETDRHICAAVLINDLGNGTGSGGCPSAVRARQRRDRCAKERPHHRRDRRGACGGRNITIVGDKIESITAAGDAATIPADATVLDLAGYTVMPGLVGMHNHMFFPQGGSPPIYSNMSISFPRLYLAMGVTTVRTQVVCRPMPILRSRRLIDGGRMLGPKVHVTAPYLEGKGSFTPVMRELTGVDDARSMVRFWAEQGATSFKAYMNITRDELRAVVEEADKLALR
jgi:hypothetical protein